MTLDWSILLLAGFGMALLLEGLLYFLSPNAVRQTYSMLLQIGDSTLRIFGLVAMIIGVVLLLVVKNFA
jgi:uncharacterized protein